MKRAKHFLNRYATPNHMKIALALLALATFVFAGGAPDEYSGGG